MGNTNSMGGIGSVGGDYPEEEIKDDRECKTCGKKLSEHSRFYDDHSYIPTKTEKE